MKEEKNQKPIKYLGGLMASLMILFGAVSCDSAGEGGAQQGEELTETEELGYDTEVEEAENDLVANEDVDYFSRWDANQDELLDENEFETVANDAGFYNEWDADADGFLSEDELNEGIYGVYDEDDDGAFTNEEFDAWNTAWGGDYDYGLWDANNDDVLDYDEFNAGIGEAGVYDTWDADNDGLYSSEEVNRGLFSTWDADEDENLATEEYNTIGYNLWGF